MELIYAILEKLPFAFLQYDFMKNAFLAVIFLAPLFALLGTMAVNNNMAFVFVAWVIPFTGSPPNKFCISILLPNFCP